MGVLLRGRWLLSQAAGLRKPNRRFKADASRTGLNNFPYWIVSRPASRLGNRPNLRSDSPVRPTQSRRQYCVNRSHFVNRCKVLARCSFDWRPRSTNQSPTLLFSCHVALVGCFVMHVPNCLVPRTPSDHCTRFNSSQFRSSPNGWSDRVLDPRFSHPDQPEASPDRGVQSPLYSHHQVIVRKNSTS